MVGGYLVCNTFGNFFPEVHCGGRAFGIYQEMVAMGTQPASLTGPKQFPWKKTRFRASRGDEAGEMINVVWCAYEEKNTDDERVLSNQSVNSTMLNVHRCPLDVSLKYGL